MSVINQVLNQLEQRGAHTVADQSMVRAVHQHKRNLTTPLLATGLVLIAGIAVWQWVSQHKPAVVAVNNAPNTVASFPIPSEPEKLIPQKQPVSASTAPAPGDMADDSPDEPLAPASRLSFELSLPPRPSPGDASAQAATPDRGQALSGSNSNPAPSAVPAGKRGKNKPALPRSQIPATTTKIAAQVAPDVVPMKQVSSSQRADAEFRRAAELTQQGRISDAIAGYEAALRLDAGHDAARQALVALLLEGKRNEDAEKLLLEGLNTKPEHTGLTMLLARLQVERGALEQATATLEKSLPFADAQPDYRAFLAALLQRQNRNEEAISHYQIVLQRVPDNGVWLMGYGISLQALQRNAEAKDAFKRALDTKALSAELQAFVQQRLKGL